MKWRTLRGDQIMKGLSGTKPSDLLEPATSDHLWWHELKFRRQKPKPKIKAKFLGNRVHNWNIFFSALMWSATVEAFKKLCVVWSFPGIIVTICSCHRPRSQWSKKVQRMLLLHFFRIGKGSNPNVEVSQVLVCSPVHETRRSVRRWPILSLESALAWLRRYGAVTLLRITASTTEEPG